MRRMMLVVTAALVMMLMTALSGAALAQPVSNAADAKCLNLARQTLGGFGQNFNPTNYTFIGGTEGPDNFTGKGTEGRDVFCGFGHNDGFYFGTLDEGDLLLGGAGNEHVGENYGTVYGDEGNDVVSYNYGTFYGGEGEDSAPYNYGTFYGGAGNDTVIHNYGTYYGDAGNDGSRNIYVTGTFYGGEGFDYVNGINDGTFVD